MLLRVCLLFMIFIVNLYANQSNEKVSLQLLWKHQFEFAGYYMAKEKGFYKDSGIDVDIKEYVHGTNIVADVENGKSTFGVGYPSIILDKTNGAKINLLSIILQSSPHVLITLKSSGINSIKDFKNKRIMTNDDEVKTASFRSMLQSQNVSLKEMKRVKHSFDINDLIDGKTDISTIFLSNEIYELDKKGIDYNIWNPKDYGFDFYDGLLFTSTSVLENKTSMVKNFNNASLKGWKYAFENIEETIKVIQEKYNTQNKSYHALKFEALELKKLAYYNTSKLGKIEKNRVQRIIDIYRLLGLSKNNINLDEFIYQSGTKKIILTKEEKNYIKNNPTIKVHNETHWAPFNYYENNQAKGYSIDYLKLIAGKVNLIPEFVSGPTWKDFLEMMKDEKLDVMLNIVKNVDRDKFINFTSPYKKHTKSLFTNLPDIHSFKDLEGKSVAVTKGFFTEGFLKKHYPKINVHTYKDTLECMKAVIEGKSDALLESFPVVNHLLKKHNLAINNVKLNIDDRLEFDFRIGTTKNNIILRNILQKAMDSLTIEELNMLNNRWLGYKQLINEINEVKLTKKEKEYLENNNITMCIDPSWMPFETFDKGKHIGISADYFKIFQRNLGKTIEVIPTKTWSESLKLAQSRKCDLLSLVMETPNRKKYMNFTTPYLNVPLVIATKIDVTFINEIKSLANKKIGIPKGYAFVEILKTKYPYIDIVEVDNIEDGLTKVNQGELFGYIGTLASVGYMFQNRFTGELKIAGKFDETWQLGIGVRNDNKILLDIMEKTIQSVDKTQQQAILNNWIAIKYEKKVDYTTLWQILIIISIVMLFFFYRQYILNKANKELQEAVDEKTKELQELNRSLENKIKIAIDENSQKDRILYSQSRMAAMGEMIGNIAHQWRQPLSIISTAASGMKLKLEFGTFQKDDAIKNIDTLMEATSYLSNTIDDFKNFLNPTKEIKSFNIKDVIEKNLKLFGASFKNKNISIVLNLDDVQINGNANELLQVIINILNNAKDALKDNDIEEKLIFIELQKIDNEAVITIKDNAGGINQDILPKIFDAYFTTKHKSMGTGIGLYMSYQIIHNSFDGHLNVINKDYNFEENSYFGAEFTINIPLKSDTKA